MIYYRNPEFTVDPRRPPDMIQSVKERKSIFMKAEAIVGIIVGTLTVAGVVWTSASRMAEYETRVKALEADQFYKGRL